MARGGAAISRARQGAIDEAVAELEQVATEISGTTKRLMITLPALWLGEAYLRAGRTVDARAQAESVLRMARERGERVLEGWALSLLGDVAGDAAAFRPEVGFAAYRDAMAITDAGGLRPLAAHCALGIARLHDRAGQPEAAREALARARALFAALSLPLAQLDILFRARSSRVTTRRGPSVARPQGAPGAPRPAVRPGRSASTRAGALRASGRR